MYRNEHATIALFVHVANLFICSTLLPGLHEWVPLGYRRPTLTNVLVMVKSLCAQGLKNTPPSVTPSVPSTSATTSSNFCNTHTCTLPYVPMDVTLQTTSCEINIGNIRLSGWNYLLHNTARDDWKCMNVVKSVTSSLKLTTWMFSGE